MKLTEEQSQYILSAFSNLQSKDDFLSLLNYVKFIIYGDRAIPFAIKHINYHCNPKLNTKRYTTFTIKKKSGAERVIHAPTKGLKAIQKCLNLILQVIYSQHQHKSANGFIPNKSIVDNANLHIGKVYVYNLDLKDFFPSIDQARIWGRLKFPPFNLNEKTNRIELANIIASLCCHQIEVERLDDNGVWNKVLKNVLPQGAPTSPTLTNIICQQLDFYLSAVAKRFNLKYSRYADDITFSSQHNVYQQDSEFIREINRIIAAQNFHIKQSKTRLQKQGFRQEVTGLVVNTKINVQKHYIKQLRQWLYYWEKLGFEKANRNFVVKYIKDKGYIKSHKPNMANVVAGKLNYLRMVKGENNATYLKLQNQFLKLTGQELITTNIVSLEVTPASHPYVKSYSIEDSTHNPKQLVNILKRFSNNNSALKYTTHSWDQRYDSYDLFMTELRNDWNTIRKDLSKLNKRLYGKISNFLFNPNLGEEFNDDKGITRIHSWGIHKITIGWSSPEISEFCRNESKAPFNYLLPVEKQIKIDGKNVIRFFDVVDIFKREIEIREDNDQFHQMLMKIWKDVLTYEFNLTFVGTKGISFFTDVQWINSAIRSIFDCMRKYTHHNEIEIVVTNNLNDNYIEVKFTQLGSICSRDVPVLLKRIKSGEGDLATIKNDLHNLCDWTIEGEFPGGNSYSIELLSFSPDIVVKSLPNNVNGFSHILKFYL
jgi:RNA-directed DNA polymerase